jgi:histone H4
MDPIDSPDATLDPEIEHEEDAVEQELERDNFRLPELSQPPSLPPANLLVEQDVAPVKIGLSGLPLNRPAPIIGAPKGNQSVIPTVTPKPFVAPTPVKAPAKKLVPSTSLKSSIGSGRGGKSAPAKKPAPTSLGGAKRHRKILRNSIEGITKPAIRRLARRGGVKRISGEVYDDVRLALRDFLKKIINDATIYCEYAHRKTVTAGDVVNSLRRNGRELYGYDK